MGGTGRYGGKGSKGKQVNTSTKGGVRPGAALALPNHYTVDILRPYHSEDGSVFVKRAGASRDGDLLPPRAWPRGWTPPTPNCLTALARGWRCWRGPYSTVSRRSSSPQTTRKKTAWTKWKCQRKCCWPQSAFKRRSIQWQVQNRSRQRCSQFSSTCPIRTP